MPIYKYTLTKYVKAYSTWVIVAISMLLVVVLGGYIPFRVAKVDTPTNYAVISVAIVAAITSFLSIFTSVFAGFKSASMFKDEVEDGTFLVMLSKPISRSKIIFFKWLALQTAIIGYTFVVAISFLFAVSVFDTGHRIAGELASMGLKTLRSQIIIVSLMLWFILFIVSLIFSSIALLLSTKLSVGTTIGISIAIGVIIPITSLVGTFTSKPAYRSITNNDAKLIEAMLSTQLSPQSETVKMLTDDANTKQMISAFKQTLVDAHSLTDSKNTLYGLGLATNETDTFKFAQAFDFNYQIQKLSEFSSEQAIPESVREGLDFSQNGQSLKTVTNVAQENNPFNGQFVAQMDVLNKLILSSWIATQPYRIATVELFVEALKKATINHPIAIPTDFLKANFTTVTSIKDEATKNQFISEIKAPNSFISWISKAVVPETDALTYKNATSGIAQIMNEIFTNDSILSFENSGMTHSEQDNFKKYFYTFGDYAKNLFFPLAFWASESAITNFMHHSSVVSKSYIYNEKESANHQDDQITSGLGYLKETLRAWNTSVYNKLASSIEQGYSLAKIKTVEYVSKFTILWIYLALALALVPISYFVIRKQDFR